MKVASLVLVVALSTITVVQGAVAAERTAECTTGAVTANGRWEHVAIPAFSSGPQEMREFGVDTQDPDILLATNGITVERSVDGGCSWKTAFSLESPPPETEYSATDSEIVDLAVGPGHVLIVISQAGARPHVVISSYGGETWRRGDDGLQAVVGTPVQGGFTATDPRYAYLLVDEGVRGADARASLRQTLFESTTAGGFWGVRGGTDPAPAATIPVVGRTVGGPEAFTGFVPDPREGGRIFLYGPTGLTSYQQGTKADLLDDPIAAAAALDNGEAPTMVLAALSGTNTVRYSADAGLTFAEFQAPGHVTSFAEGLRPDEFYLSAGGRVLLRGSGGSEDVSDGTGGAVDDLVAARSQERLSPFRAAEILTLYGRGEGTIVRTSTRRIINSPPPPGSFMIGSLPPLDPDNPLPGWMTPEVTEIVLEEGQEKTIPFELYLPETPTPLDVFFDVDTTNSMGPAIDGLRAGMADIIGGLTEEGIDVWFGAAQYKSFDTPPAYELLRNVAPASEELVAALNSLAPAGGNLETQLESLYQIVTGAGSKRGRGIEPGQQAEWRKGSLRVVVNMTDEPISTGGPHPPYDKVARALIGDDVVHFGIAVTNKLTEAQLGSPLPGLLRISRESRSVAPHEGADCNGDGRPDIYGGEPLVCVVDPDRARDAGVVGGAIVNVLKAVEDVGEVEIVATAADGSPLPSGVAVPQPAVITGVNFKEPHQLGFAVTFACPEIPRTTRFPMIVQTQREAGPLSRAVVDLTCKAIPPEPRERRRPPPRIFPIVPATIVAALVPPPPLSNPPQQPNPNTNPNPNPNPQSQGQGQGAAATQEQEQPQLALAEQGASDTEPATARRSGSRQEYAMSRYTPPAPREDAVFLATAALITLGFGGAAVARGSTSCSPVTRGGSMTTSRISRRRRGR